MAKLKRRDGYQIINGKQTDIKVHEEIFDNKKEQKLIDKINDMYRTRKDERS